MNKELELAKELIDFIYDSPTSFHVVNNIKNYLQKLGFKELKEEEKWNLELGGKYFITKNNSAIVSFVVSKEDAIKNGFKIIGAHTDSPGFRIKPNAEVISEKYMKLNTEVYGGPILNTWLDRPLSIAGRVVLKSKTIMEPIVKFLNVKKPILIIPNLAIHMNRDVNKGIELNRQKDILPLLGIVNDNMEKNDFLLNIIQEELNVDKEDILDFDLFLYEFEKGKIVGNKEEFISSGKLDDLAMVFSGIRALANTDNPKSTDLMVCFDNEEVGSGTKQGADSPMLSSILERIIVAFNGNREDYFRALSKSFVISSDMAHAVHPNNLSKTDPTNRPILNGGPAIKISASQTYTSDAISSSIFEQICNSANVPVQKFVNRSDQRGGSTIGPILTSQLDVNSVDIGTAILAMHSVRELGGVKDNMYTLKCFEEFYKL